MKLHPLLRDPQAVLVSQTPLANPLTWDDYDRAALRVMAAMQIELEGETVAIKPNVTVGEKFADPDSGITTHPGFVQGMITYLQAYKGRDVYIVEDPRNSDDDEPRHWRKTGYDTVSEETGAILCCPTTVQCIEKTVPVPQALKSLRVSRLVTAPDTVLFNVPKLKTHNLAITTLCMKNLMGLVNVFDRHYCGQAWRGMPEAEQEHSRPRQEWITQAIHERWQAGLARRLIDTAQIIQPHVNVVEGVVGREGTGFQRGRNFTLGLAIAGVNMVAVDSVASYLMGFDPQQLVYLRMAAEAGLGTHDLAHLRIYTVRDGEVVPCQDVASLRVDPPFKVIRNIIGDEA